MGSVGLRMADWIVGLRKAAVESQPGASDEVLARVETRVGLPLPGELRKLYAQMDGGSFEPDVALYPLEEAPDAAGVVEATLRGLAGLPQQGLWCFGLRGGADHLFAAQRSALEVLPPEVTPGWLSELPGRSWLYGRKNTDTGELELFKSLQALLWNLIPPVESEDFGEHTFAKAMSAVHDALQAIEETTTTEAGEGAKRPKKRPAKRAAKRVAKRAKGSKAPKAKRKVAGRKKRR